MTNKAQTHNKRFALKKAGLRLSCDLRNINNFTINVLFSKPTASHTLHLPNKFGICRLLPQWTSQIAALAVILTDTRLTKTKQFEKRKKITYEKIHNMA